MRILYGLLQKISITEFCVCTGMLLCLEWDKGTATPTAVALGEEPALFPTEHDSSAGRLSPNTYVYTTHGIKCLSCYPISLGFVPVNEVCCAPVMVPRVREHVLYWIVLEC